MYLNVFNSKLKVTVPFNTPFSISLSNEIKKSSRRFISILKNTLSFNGYPKKHVNKIYCILSGLVL